MKKRITCHFIFHIILQNLTDKFLANCINVWVFYFSFEQRKAEPFVRHNCFVAIPPTMLRQVLAAAGVCLGLTQACQPIQPRQCCHLNAALPASPLEYGAIALCSQVNSRLSGSGGTIITRYTKSLDSGLAVIELCPTMYCGYLLHT